MFERFTTRAREVVVGAQREARELAYPTIGTEHLLLAMLTQEGGVARKVLTAYGVEYAEVRRLVGSRDDAEALRSIGIDLDEVRARVEETFGPGALDRPAPPRRRGLLGRWGVLGESHIPFTDGAKKSLELSLRIALSLKHNYIGTEHLLLGVLKEERGRGARILADAGVTEADARQLVLTALRKAA